MHLQITQTGIPPSKCRLIFRARAVADERTLDEYEITEGSMLHCVLALRT